jgi:hypothetical protein
MRALVPTFRIADDADTWQLKTLKVLNSSRVYTPDQLGQAQDRADGVRQF